MPNLVRFLVSWGLSFHRGRRYQVGKGKGSVDGFQHGDRQVQILRGRPTDDMLPLNTVYGCDDLMLQDSAKHELPGFT